MCCERRYNSAIGRGTYCRHTHTHSARQLSLKTSNSISVASLHLMYQLTHFCVDEANSNKKTKEEKINTETKLLMRCNRGYVAII